MSLCLKQCESRCEEIRLPTTYFPVMPFSRLSVTFKTFQKTFKWKCTNAEFLRGSVVGVVTGLLAGWSVIRISACATDFSLLQDFQTCSHSNAIGGFFFFPGCEVAGASN